MDYVVRLYVAGGTPPAQRAEATLRQVMNHAPGRFELEEATVDGRDTTFLQDADVIGYIERTEDGILVIDEEGVVTYANLAARDLLAPHRRTRLEGASLGQPLTVDGHQRLELIDAAGNSLSVDARITPCRFEVRSGWGSRCDRISLRPLSQALAGGLDATFHELRNNLTGMLARSRACMRRTTPKLATISWTCSNAGSVACR